MKPRIRIKSLRDALSAEGVPPAVEELLVAAVKYAQAEGGGEGEPLTELARRACDFARTLQAEAPPLLRSVK